jgi:HEAT repeat protein
MKKHAVAMSTNPQFPKSAGHCGILSKTLSAIMTVRCLTALRTVFCGGFLLLIAMIGCEPKQQIDHLKVGRQQLLNSGLAVDAVKHLKQAEINEVDKVPPRALLVLAYTHGLSAGTAKAQGLGSEFIRERTERLAALGDEEIEYLLQILVRRSRLQKDAMQVVIDKGESAFPVMIAALGNVEFQNLHGDIIEMMYKIGTDGDGLETMVDAIQEVDTSTEVKIALIRLIGRIGGLQGLGDLEKILSQTEDPSLKMEISVALYRLGKHEYSGTIVKGLDNDNVNVRRAAARALMYLSDYPRDSVLKALRDADERVVTYAAQALQKRPTAQAVIPLTEVLTGKADNAAKQAASEALRIHAEQKLTKGLTTRLTKTLISGNIANPEDRLRILHLLRKDPLMNQIKVASLVNPQLAYDLDQYLKQTETHEMVKEELRRLLSELD